MSFAEHLRLTSICSSISECLQRKYVFICIKNITYKRIFNLVNYYFIKIAIVLSINSASCVNHPLKNSRKNGITTRTLILTCTYVINFIPTIRCLKTTVFRLSQNIYKLYLPNECINVYNLYIFKPFSSLKRLLN